MQEYRGRSTDKVARPGLRSSYRFPSHFVAHRVKAIASRDSEKEKDSAKEAAHLHLFFDQLDRRYWWSMSTSWSVISVLNLVFYRRWRILWNSFYLWVIRQISRDSKYTIVEKMIMQWRNINNEGFSEQRPGKWPERWTDEWPPTTTASVFGVEITATPE